MSYIGNTTVNQNYVPAIDYFNGNGSTTAFTLSRPVASVAQVQAVINNVPQNPGDAFTVSGSTITFTSAPPSGTNNIYVYYTSPNTQVVQPGQGTVGTVQIADSAVTTAKIADANVTQAKLAAGVAGNGPAFSAYQSSAQSLSANTITKIQLQTEEFDTANCFDSSTNYRFTPNVAGYYQISGGIQNASTFCQTIAFIYKNGSRFKDYTNIANPYGGGVYGSALVYMNGSTDYVELYGLFSTTQNCDARATTTYFQGVLVRAA